MRRMQNNSSELEDYKAHVLPSKMAKIKLEDAARKPADLILDEVTEDLLDLDPAEWKEQDHYHVLGLSSLRYKAERSQIKQAHQMRALQFHPDKRAVQGDNHDDAFFKCVQRAYEALINPIKRMQFDSVDPAISDSIPKSSLEDGQDFFNTYGPIFEREARFSKKKPVPKLGTMDTPREQMEEFYSFWAHFDSWRSFEYLDKEKEQMENREEKRWYEKQNKAERMRRKKEDNKRISTLVQQAMSLDPRIEMYKEQERREKENKRLAREAVANRAEQERRQAEEAKRAQDSLKLGQERKQAAEEKRLREEKKQELRLMKKAIRHAAKSNNYMLDDDQKRQTTAEAVRAAEIDILLDNMQKEAIEKLHSTLLDSSSDRERMRAAIFEQITAVVARIPAVGPSFTSFARGSDIAENNRSSREIGSAQYRIKNTAREWSAKELELLIKAVNKFPSGTALRWQTISKWMSQHGEFPRRTDDEILTKTAELRGSGKSGSGLLVKSLQNRKMNNDDKNLKNEASIRYDGPLQQQHQQQKGEANRTEVSKSPNTDRPWSSEEQAQLERALQAYPPTYKGADRWDKIAEAVVGRTKKDCKQRVKFLVEQVRSKSK
ncbi:DnaJ (Hsp40), sub C, member 2 [Coemansia sp. RSA 1358]|nr:DnaJ (Hsp40), sub C, member 2 [Coemansia sp. RSA 1358]